MKPSLPLLYTYRRCPYVMRARMGLLLAGVAFDAFEIVLRDKPRAMLEASPKGTVPVLVLPGGQVLEQSWDIVEWALTRPDAHASSKEWWSRSLTPSNQALLQANDGDFKRHLDRYKYPERFAQEEGISPEVAREFHRVLALDVLLHPLEERLTVEPYLGGSEPAATDLGIFPFVRQFAAVDATWFEAEPLPHLQSWLQGWLKHPLFLSGMAKIPSNQRVPFPTEPAHGTIS